MRPSAAGSRASAILGFICRSRMLRKSVDEVRRLPAHQVEQDLLDLILPFLARDIEARQQIGRILLLRQEAGALI